MSQLLFGLRRTRFRRISLRQETLATVYNHSTLVRINWNKGRDLWCPGREDIEGERSLKRTGSRAQKGVGASHSIRDTCSTEYERQRIWVNIQAALEEEYD